MHAVLRHVAASGAEVDLDAYRPPATGDFGFTAVARIGPDSGPGEELFNVTLCTPKWLASTTRPQEAKGFELLRGTLFVSRWDPALARRAISDLCVRATGEDWNEVASRLGRYLDWEFDDYTVP